MKILHINKFFDLHGGAEIYMHRLMEMQRAFGHEVHAFSTKSPKNVHSEDEKYFVTRYHLDQPHPLKTQLKIAKNFLWNTEAKKALARMLDDVRPDVIHIHNIYHHLSTSILSEIRKRHIPTVMTLHDYKLAAPNYGMFDHGAPCERSKDGKYYQVILHRCLSPKLFPNVLAAIEMYFTKTTLAYEKTVNLFLCPSKFMKEKMEDWGEPAGKLRYAPNPADLDTEPAPLGGGYILYAGRLSSEKGLDNFLRAAVTIPELPVKIAGKGPELEKLERIVKESGAAHIEFLGFVAPEKLKEIRRRADALFLPTISYENASTSVLEAMASGIPSIVTRIGGNPELITDGENGFLVIPNDVKDWQRNLRRFQALSLEARRAMGEKGRKKIKNGRTWQQHTERILGFYKEVKTAK